MKCVCLIGMLLFGVLISSASHAGNIIYTYDNAGRLTKASYFSNMSIAYTYDDNGNLLSRRVGLPETLYDLTVTNGTGSGQYAAGAVVNIQADVPAAGKVFGKWTGDVEYVADVTSASTTVTMPAGNVTVTATFAVITGPSGYITTARPEFAWQPVSGATRYHLWIDDADGNCYRQWHSAEALGCLEGEQPCRITPELDLDLGRYTWWIQAANETAEGKWSVGMVFTVYDPDKMAAFIGSWADSGTWRYDLATARWQRLTIEARQLAVGDLDGDGRGDLAGIWPSGLWVKSSGTGQWLLLTRQLPDTLTMGDLNADGRDDIIGSWSSGVWYWNSLDQEWLQLTVAARLLATGKVRNDEADILAGVWDSGLWIAQSGDWRLLTPLQPTALALGDLTGDGRIEVIASWPDFGVWYWNSLSEQWTRLSPLPATLLAAGDLTGNGQDELAGVWEGSGVWLYRGRERQWESLSDELPAAIAVGRLDAEREFK